MSKSKITPFFLAVFGSPDAGKTFVTEKLVNAYKGTRLVFNYGCPDDWKGYEEIVLKMHNKELHYEYKGALYHFDSSFNIHFKGKGVKAQVIRNKKAVSRALFVSLNLGYVPKCFLVFEDASSTLEGNLHSDYTDLLSRLGHAGIRIVTISHDINYFPKKAWAYVTDFRIFKLVNNLTQEKKKQLPNAEKIEAAINNLRKLPQYSYYSFGALSGRTTLYKHTK